jgi:choice-of-anchor B domain-containing protein
MKILNAILFFLLLIRLEISAQNLNITLAAHLPYPGQTCANICGYVDSLNNEYALVGSSLGLSIVDVTVPTSPVKVFQHIGPTGSYAEWEEIKVMGHYAYVVTEAGGGVQIFNLRSLPDTSGIIMHSYTGDSIVTGQISSIHALHIDGHYLYLYGGVGSLDGGDAKVFDLTDPWNPRYAGHYTNPTDPYVHDGYVRNDTGYFGHIYSGFFSIVDFTNKSNPILLGSQTTPSAFTHNTWLSTNSKTLFTTDEVGNSFLTAYDVSNPTNIIQLDKIQSNPGSGSIVHNTHIIKKSGNDYAVTSWYRDGITIVDAGRPTNLVQVGNYDTYTTDSGYGFNGTWGVYPFLPSGTIVVSNIEDGLYVLTPTYQRACYLEGIITDSVTSLPINSASVQILTTTTTKYSDITGNYATGIPSPGGFYNITYTKAGYYTKTLSGINLSSGIVNTQNIQLVPLGAGTSDIQAESDVATIYPNPSSSEISISYSLKDNDNKAATLLITDVTGRTIEKILLHQNKATLRINPTLSPGIYFVTITNTSRQLTPVRFVKTK